MDHLIRINGRNPIINPDTLRMRAYIERKRDVKLLKTNPPSWVIKMLRKRIKTYENIIHMLNGINFRWKT